MPKHRIAEYKRMVEEKPEIEKFRQAITDLRDSLRKRLDKKIVVDEMIDIIFASLFSYVYGRKFNQIEQIMEVFALLDIHFHQTHEAAALAALDLMKRSDDV